MIENSKYQRQQMFTNVGSYYNHYYLYQEACRVSTPLINIKVYLDHQRREK
jgi:hypothetical protein